MYNVLQFDVPVIQYGLLENCPIDKWLYHLETFTSGELSPRLTTPEGNVWKKIMFAIPTALSQLFATEWIKSESHTI